MLATNLETPGGAAEKNPCRVGNADTAPDDCGDGRSGHAQFRKESDAEDEHRVEHDVKAIRDHENAQRDRGIAGSSKNAVQQKEKHDHAGCSVHQPHERQPDLDHFLFGAEQTKDIRCKHDSRNAHHDRYKNA